MKLYVFGMSEDLSRISVVLNKTMMCLYWCAVRLRNGRSEMWMNGEKSLARG